jgi:hypothetical protein
MLQREQQIQPTKTSSDVSNMSKSTCEDINIDLKSYFSKSHISIPFLEFLKIPSQRNKIKQILGLGEGKEESSEQYTCNLENCGKRRIEWRTRPILHIFASEQFVIAKLFVGLWGINQWYAFENNATISPQGNKTIPEHVFHG